MQAQVIFLATVVLYLLARSNLSALETIVSIAIIAALALAQHRHMFERFILKTFGGSRLPPEKAAIASVLAGLKQYRSQLQDGIFQRRKRLFFMLDRDQQSLAIRTYQRYKATEGLADKNAEFLGDIVKFGMATYGITNADILRANPIGLYATGELISHVVRDWSKDASARNALIGPLLNALNNRKGRMLVPGSGLGRLAYDAAELGYTVDAIEMSPSMILGSQYALSKPKDTIVYPYLTLGSHWKLGTDQLEGIPIQFSTNDAKVNIIYGNFLKDSSVSMHKYDAICTLYFIDTAQNVFDYISRIKQLLAPGGVWVNYGPLKWGSAPFIEASVDELLEYISQMGFEVSPIFKGHDRYDGSPKSLVDTKYGIVGWSAVLSK